TPSSLPPSPWENWHLVADITTPLQVQNRSQPDPRRLERTRGLSRWLGENIRRSSSAPLPSCDSRNTFPSSRADKPPDLWRTTCSGASFLRSSAASADFQKWRSRSPVGLRQCLRVYGCTAHPRAVCPRVHLRVQR